MSATRQRYAQDDQSYSTPDSRGPGLPRGVRPQRSMYDVSPNANRRVQSSKGSSMPTTPRMGGYPREMRSSSDPYNRGTKSSASSVSSQVSSLFSRKESYESSTSADEPTPKPSRRGEWSSPSHSRPQSRSTASDAGGRVNDGNSSRWESRQGSRLRYSTEDDDYGRYQEPDPGLPQTDGYGAALWNKISTAANSLTVNVSKAWAQGIFTDDGEVTPPDGETRLTRALKSYHLNKARTAADLPSWLFTEEERRVTKSRFTFNQAEEENYDTTSRQGSRGRESGRKGLKAVYDELETGSSREMEDSRYVSPPASRFSQTERTEWNRSRSRMDGPRERYDAPVTNSWIDGGYQQSSQSKATSRLQAMRDARRPTIREPHVDSVDRDADSRETRRVGLPRGPKQRQI